MSNLMDKVREMFNYNGYSDDVDLFDETEETFEDEQEEESKGLFSRKTQQKQLPSGNVKMVIIQPTVVDQAYEICEMLKDRKSIIINLEHLSKEEGRRIVDITSGAATVLDGSLRKITNGIILLAPSNYDIDADIPEEAKSKFGSSWLKGQNQ